MLIYHPAFDAYHCVFRMMALMGSIPDLEVDKARLLDFYLAFPSAISDIRLPSTLAHGRRLAKSLSNTYRDPLNPKAAFRDMSQIQLAALRNIAALGLIDLNGFEQGVVKRIDSVAIPESLGENLSSYLAAQAEVLKFLSNDLAQIPLRGLDGLKHRTALLEYRYDTP
ncbi:ABC-three component system middle component 5 [Pseudomonas alliivorans]|nr:ABC-three component system middle component 5 [Pseudomonas alliivorans]MEE4721551.1 ABC-three component system middle component 5 [Pseudomonas alliivorans]MEE4757669.1 ABC-three component system middle component 5 [Pseudomonas alliivorans]MEE4764310.1 ABC-three component system middle component 5 [Pseudomonas alliivorans]MEE4772797.1 ABC-three component system middle component 5 [Pseudomonas alliivorans]